MIGFADDRDDRVVHPDTDRVADRTLVLRQEAVDVVEVHPFEPAHSASLTALGGMPSSRAFRLNSAP